MDYVKEGIVERVSEDKAANAAKSVDCLRERADVACVHCIACGGVALWVAGTCELIILWLEYDFVSVVFKEDCRNPSLFGRGSLDNPHSGQKNRCSAVMLSSTHPPASLSLPYY